MKKFIQISLVVILVFVLVQAIAGAPIVSTSKIDSSVASGTFLTADTSVEDAHAATCMVQIRGVICVKPLVGWNT